MRYLFIFLMINFWCLGDDKENPSQDPGMLMTDEPEKEEIPIIIDGEQQPRQCPCAQT